MDESARIQCPEVTWGKETEALECGALYNLRTNHFYIPKSLNPTLLNKHGTQWHQLNLKIELIKESGVWGIYAFK